jgi:hypothetical protein
MVSRRVVPLLVALLAMAVPAAAIGKPLVRSVSRSIRTTDGVKSATVKCPRGYSAVHGATGPLPLDVNAIRSAPARNARRWLFTFASDSRSRAAVVVRCARARARTKRRKGVKVGAGEIRGVKVRCGKGRAAVGYGDSQGLASDTPQVPPRIDLYRARLRGRTVNFGVRNDSTDDGSITLYARCLKRPRGSRLVRRSGSVRLPNGEKSTTRRCPRRTLALAPGFSFDPDDGVFAQAAYLSGSRAGRFRFNSSLVDQTTATTEVLCLKPRR